MAFRIDRSALLKGLSFWGIALFLFVVDEVIDGFLSMPREILLTVRILFAISVFYGFYYLLAAVIPSVAKPTPHQRIRKSIGIVFILLAVLAYLGLLVVAGSKSMTQVYLTISIIPLAITGILFLKKQKK